MSPGNRSMAASFGPVILGLVALSGSPFAHGGSYTGRESAGTPRFGAACGPSRAVVSKESRAQAVDREYSWSWWWEVNGDPYVLAKLAAAREELWRRHSDGDCWVVPRESVNPAAERVVHRQRCLALVRMGLTDPFFDARAASAIAVG